MLKKTKLFTILLITLLLTACSSISNNSYAKHTSYQGNLWDVMADNFSLPDETTANRSVRAQLDWYLRHQKLMARQGSNAKPFLYYIYQQVRARHMPAELALLPMIESGYNPFAHSKAGAVGLWQLMPSTATGYGVKIDWWYDGRRDVVASTKAALNYLSYLNKFFHGNWLLAVAAYNSGEGTVLKAIKRNRAAGRPTTFWYLKLPAETRTYVTELLALATIFSHPDEFPTKIPAIADESYFVSVNVGSQIDLAYAAKMTGITLTQLTNLNAGYSRWATDPAGPYNLLIPIDREAQFLAALRSVPKSKLVTWHRYKIQHGETLNEIAARFHTSVSMIESINHMRSASIQTGAYILVPMDSKEIENIAIHEQRAYFQSLRSIPDVNVIHHTVRSGESLSSIAREYNVTLRQLEFWNGITSHQILQPGTKLTIWPSKLARRRSSAEITYTVRKGDTLSHIAARYHTSVKAIERHNQLSSSILQPGQRIRIPVIREAQKIYYMIKRGDTLSSIATRYRVTIKDLLRWNHIKDPHKIFVGEKLVIYP